MKPIKTKKKLKELLMKFAGKIASTPSTKNMEDIADWIIKEWDNKDNA